MVSRPNTLTVHFEGDISQFSRAVRQANGELTSFERSTGGAGRSLSGLTAGVSTFALGATAAVGTLAAGVAAVRNFASAASDMAETQSKVGVVFGESAEAVRRWSEDSARAMGLSQQKALEAAATVGNFAQALGVARDAAAPMSQAIVQLAGDLASFNNASPEDTLIALRSGLAGETEPMRRLGVAINATTVEAKALEMGFERVNGALTEGAKVQARYALIMEQTKSAQGDFARTSDGLANQQRTLTANFEDLRAKLGAGVTPALAAATRELNKWLESKEVDQFTRDVAEGMAELGQAAQTAGRAIVELNRASRELTGSGLFTWLQEGLKAVVPGLGLLRQGIGALATLQDRRELAATEGGRGAGLADSEFNIGGTGRIRTREEIYGPPGPIFPLPDTALDKLNPTELQERLDAAALAAQKLAMDAMPNFGSAAEKASGGLGSLSASMGDMDRRMAEAFELTDIRNLQLAHKIMEEAELAAAEAVRERTLVEQALMEQQRGMISYLSGLGQRNVRFAPGVFETLARAGGLKPIGDFENITDGSGNPIPRVDVVVP